MADAYFLRAEIHNQKEEWEEAIDAYTKGLSLDKENHLAYFKRANAYQQAGYHRRFAINDLSEAIALQPTVEYYKERAHIYARTINTRSGLYDYDKAIHDITKALKLEPDNYELYHLRGDYKYDRGEKAAAMLDMNKAIDINDSDPRLWSDRGLMKLLNEDFAGAKSDLDQAVLLQPENRKHYTIRAHASYNIGDFQGSVNDYTKAVEMIMEEISNTTNEQKIKDLSDDIRGIYLIRGSAFIQMNRIGEACDDFYRSRNLGERRARNYLRRYCGN